MTTNPDAHPIAPWLTPERRAWLYRLVVTALPLLVLYGYLSEQEAPLWLAFAGAMIGSSTAALHTPTRIVQEPADDGAVAWATVALVIIAIVVLLWALGEVPR